MENTAAQSSETPNWIPDTDAFGARLALVRWKLGWNLAEAERECALSQNTWGNWEAGAMPRNFIEAISKIAWRTKVDRYWLMDGTGSPNGSEPPTTDYGAGVWDILTRRSLVETDPQPA
jgi:hypothetical protein